MGRRTRPASVAPGLALAFALFLPAAAQAQLGASVRIESDYRFRGVSLSDGRPDVHLDLAWDHASGAYAGVSATAVELERGARRAALLGYAGYARAPDAQAPGWEAGLSAAHFAGAAGYDYAELYAGLIGERWNARLAYSPDYFGQGRRTLYAELNAGRALAPPWRVFAHAGALAALGGAADGARVRGDLRLGAAVTREAWELQLAWVAAGSDGFYPLAYPGTRRSFVLTLARFV